MKILCWYMMTKWTFRYEQGFGPLKPDSIIKGKEGVGVLSPRI